MDSSAVSVALTVCIFGSSAASYAFGMLINKKKTDDLEHEINELLQDPNYYRDVRDAYIAHETKLKRGASRDGQYASFNR